MFVLSHCLWRSDSMYMWSDTINAFLTIYIYNLCLTEKVFIIRANTKGLLNKRTELLSKCRHRNKYVVGNLKRP